MGLPLDETSKFKLSFYFSFLAILRLHRPTATPKDHIAGGDQGSHKNVVMMIEGTATNKDDEDTAPSDCNAEYSDTLKKPSNFTMEAGRIDHEREKETAFLDLCACDELTERHFSALLGIFFSSEIEKDIRMKMATHLMPLSISRDHSRKTLIGLSRVIFDEEVAGKLLHKAYKDAEIEWKEFEDGNSGGEVQSPFPVESPAMHHMIDGRKLFNPDSSDEKTDDYSPSSSTSIESKKSQFRSMATEEKEEEDNCLEAKGDIAVAEEQRAQHEAELKRVDEEHKAMVLKLSEENDNLIREKRALEAEFQKLTEGNDLQTAVQKEGKESEPNEIELYKLANEELEQQQRLVESLQMQLKSKEDDANAKLADVNARLKAAIDSNNGLTQQVASLTNGTSTNSVQQNQIDEVLNQPNEHFTNQSRLETAAETERLSIANTEVETAARLWNELQLNADGSQQILAVHTTLLRSVAHAIGNAFDCRHPRNFSRIRQIIRCFFCIMGPLTNANKMYYRMKQSEAKKICKENIDFDQSRSFNSLLIECDNEVIETLEEQDNEITAYILRVKHAIDTSKVISDRDLWNFIRFGNAAKRITIHLLHIGLVYEFVVSNTVHQGYYGLGSKDTYIENAKLLAHKVDPDTVFDENTTTIHNFMAAFILPGLDKDETCSLAAQVAHELLDNLGKAPTGTDKEKRAAFLSTAFEQAGSHSIDGSAVTKDDAYCNDVRKRQRMVRIFLVLLLRKKIVSCLPRLIFLERGYFCSVLNGTRSDIVAGFTCLSKEFHDEDSEAAKKITFYEKYHDEDSEAVKNITKHIVARKWTREDSDTGNRALLIECVQQIECLRYLVQFSSSTIVDSI